MDNTEYTINVRCTEASGQDGTFISQVGSNKAISPLCDGLYELYPWMAKNGWKSSDYNAKGELTPWRAVKVAPQQVAA
jgi:hypothetical protein